MKNYYFAYGSNLNLVDWQLWCIQRGYSPDSIEPIEEAVLPDYRLAFDYYSSTRDGGVLNVVPATGSVVVGMIFKVSEEGWSALDAKEGVSAGCYERLNVVVLGSAGEPVTATTYVVAESSKDPSGFVQPSDKYVDIVLEGYRKWDFPITPLEGAAQHNVQACEISNIFVYGTLMRRECRFPILAQSRPKCILMGETAGELYDLGSYPGLAWAREGAESIVRGEFVRFNDIQTVLHTLDGVEGFAGFGSESNLFRRELTSVHIGEGRMGIAWTYRYDQPLEGYGKIESGCWREHNGTLDEFIARLVRIHSRGNETAFAWGLGGTDEMISADQVPSFVASLYPIHESVQNGKISERRMAEISNNWRAMSSPRHLPVTR